MLSRRRIYQIMEAGHPDDLASRIFDWAIIGLIIANVAAAVVSTLPAVADSHGTAFLGFEIVSVAIFTVEYLVRIWVSVEHLPWSQMKPLKARLRYMCQPYPLIDLLAILPFFLAFILPLGDGRVLRLLRLLRLLKLARYSPALATLGRVLMGERRALFAAMLIMSALLLVTSTVLYNLERVAQPDAFGSVPDAAWWALATLTTVGYGDAVPVTAWGRVAGGVVMVLGVGMFTLPVAILASGFASEIHRRDFVVTWGLVARVPLFNRLDAMSISRVMNLLRSHVVEARSIIMRRGDVAEAMYFVASGEVELDTSPEPTVVTSGGFFGEIALLRNSERKITATALTRCRILELAAEDFRDLTRRDVGLREAILDAADERLPAEG